MNNDQLDHQLRQLFEADGRSIDPNGAAATALLESITSETEQTPSVPSFEGNVISVADQPPKASRGRILLVAAAILLALLGIGRWLRPSTEEAPVITDDFDVNGSAEIVPDGPIVGAAEPRVLIVKGEGGQAAIDCFLPSAFTEGDFNPYEFGQEERLFQEIPGFEGTSILGSVISTAGTFAEIDFSVLEAEGERSWCLRSAVTGSSSNFRDRESTFENGPLEMLITASPSGSQDSVIPSDEDFVVAVGRHDGSVASMNVPELSSDDQQFSQLGEQWFFLTYRGTNHVPVDVEFVDGTVERLQLASSEFRTYGPPTDCQDECLIDLVAERFVELASQAAAAGADRQAAFLTSGVLSQAEYDAAEVAFVACLEEAGIEFDPPLILEDGTADADAAQSCFDAEIAFIEQARFLQNEITPFDFSSLPGFDFPDVEEDTDPDDPGNDAEDSAADLTDTDSLITESRQLFGGGLSREELEDLWDGYPYAIDERDARIDRYLTDFAWMREGIVVEVSLFEQFRGSGNFQPIVSAQSMQDRNLAAAFVLGVVDDQLVIRRLPEAATRSFSTYDSSSDTVSTTVRGVEGGVTAFLEGVELEALPDNDGGATTFLLPSDYQLESVVTIVGASPEEPGAEAVVLN